MGHSQPESRAWRAAKASAAAMAGPAGLAVSSSLLCAIAYGSGSALYPEAGGFGLTNPQALPALVGGLGAAAGALGAAAAGAVGFIQGALGKDNSQAPGVKESLIDAWRSARSHLVFGGAGVGLFAGASLMSSVGQGLESAGSVGMLMAMVPVAAAAVASTVVGAKEALKNSLDNAARALGDKEALAQAAPSAESQAKPVDLAPDAVESIELSGEPASRLSGWRKARSPEAPIAPAAPKTSL